MITSRSDKYFGFRKGQFDCRRFSAHLWIFFISYGSIDFSFTISIGKCTNNRVAFFIKWMSIIMLEGFSYGQCAQNVSKWAILNGSKIRSHCENQPKQLGCVYQCVANNDQPGKICNRLSAFEITLSRFLCEVSETI